jgi:hypothetical protein
LENEGVEKAKMATDPQALGKFGEERVTKDCSCPKCKRPKAVVRLAQKFSAPTSFATSVAISLK